MSAVMATIGRGGDGCGSLHGCACRGHRCGSGRSMRKGDRRRTLELRERDPGRALVGIEHRDQFLQVDLQPLQGARVERRQRRRQDA